MNQLTALPRSQQMRISVCTDHVRPERVNQQFDKWRSELTKIAFWTENAWKLISKPVLYIGNELVHKCCQAAKTVELWPNFVRFKWIEIFVIFDKKFDTN